MTTMDRRGPSSPVHLPPRDLVDFYVRWNVFRPDMEKLLQSEVLTPDEARTLRWLVALADRVREEDLGPPGLTQDI